MGLERWLGLKSTGCLFRIPGFSSQQPHSGSQPLVTPVLGDAEPSSLYWEAGMHRYRHTQAEHSCISSLSLLGSNSKVECLPKMPSTGLNVTLYLKRLSKWRQFSERSQVGVGPDLYAGFCFYLGAFVCLCVDLEQELKSGTYTRSYHTVHCHFTQCFPLP